MEHLMFSQAKCKLGLGKEPPLGPLSGRYGLFTNRAATKICPELKPVTCSVKGTELHRVQSIYLGFGGIQEHGFSFSYHPCLLLHLSSYGHMY